MEERGSDGEESWLGDDEDKSKTLVVGDETFTDADGVKDSTELDRLEFWVLSAGLGCSVIEPGPLSTSYQALIDGTLHWLSQVHQL